MCTSACKQETYWFGQFWLEIPRIWFVCKYQMTILFLLLSGSKVQAGQLRLFSISSCFFVILWRWLLTSKIDIWLHFTAKILDKKWRNIDSDFNSVKFGIYLLDQEESFFFWFMLIISIECWSYGFIFQNITQVEVIHSKSIVQMPGLLIEKNELTESRKLLKLFSLFRYWPI